ncbi:hypothetical protein Nham_3653 [Nitrobacter hamburgensis X14]|uniref:Uncharacterized protein n=1 Tax=Nitrobacter hamburgensis (strain DSM 10229 / NCIMB 13809 / X14) TaxID=323097 RepID=Q1QHB6_NITHX|nr:hypothetical protein Nham_3653 [Nitrobacter hamburgensis X14]
MFFMQTAPTSLENALICALQPLHRKFDLAAWQLSPGLDRAHIRRGRPAFEERPCRLAGLVSGLGEGLSGVTIVCRDLSAPGGHPVSKVFRGSVRHRGTPHATSDR